MTTFEEELESTFSECVKINSPPEKGLDGKSPNPDGKRPIGCKHKFIEEDGCVICEECGIENDMLDFEPEWHNYSSTDNKTGTDSSRCHKPRNSIRGGIDKVFQDCGISISDAYKKQTQDKYQKVVEGRTIRGKSRKAIVAACLFYVYRDNSDIRTSDEVGKMFGITKNKMSDGLTKYSKIFKEARTTYIKPADMINRIMVQVGINNSHHTSISAVEQAIRGTSHLINHSSPQSVAAAVIWLYLCRPKNSKLKEELGITKGKFAEKVGLSDITIGKLVKEMSEILGLN